MPAKKTTAPRPPAKRRPAPKPKLTVEQRLSRLESQMEGIQNMIQANQDRAKQAFAAKLAQNPDKLQELKDLVAQAENGVRT